MRWSRVHWSQTRWHWEMRCSQHASLTARHRQQNCGRAPCRHSYTAPTLSCKFFCHANPNLPLLPPPAANGIIFRQVTARQVRFIFLTGGPAREKAWLAAQREYAHGLAFPAQWHVATGGLEAVDVRLGPASKLNDEWAARRDLGDGAPLEQDEVAALAAGADAPLA